MFVHHLIYQGMADAIAFRGVNNVTYAQLQEEVAKYRTYFYQIGIRSGDNIGLFSRNSVEYVCSYMAIASLGAVVVPFNFQLTCREIAYIVKDACMKHIVTAEPLNIAEELHRYGYRQEVRQSLISDIKQQISQIGEMTPSFDNRLQEDQPCVIIYTSGTTGNPKGAVLSHKNLVANAGGLQKVLDISAQDNVLCVLPMYHCFAWTCAVLNPLLCGASITVLEAFAPKEALAAIKDYGVTVMYGVPPIYNLLTRVGTPEDLQGIRLLVSGGASLPENVARQFRQKYGKTVTEGYGLSEASPVVTLNPAGKTKFCSIGKALPGLEVRVVNSKGETLPPGEVGELIVKGHTVMQGYFNLPLETSLALRDGWLYTGDLAYQDTEDYLFIVDRLKDMIISNGENIYPREIEELLHSYPGIIEAAVVGQADELRGQAVCAYIVMAPDQAFDKKALKAYLQGNLAAYKMPRDFVAVDALPKNQTGKILKRVLRDQFTKDANDARVG
ncbi:class I adenylate-forming enzyme family protein [Acetonema longum]|uniref:Long-chain-fatty-acid-coa ligase n=1 Tax=Acetonema longum DSM 6540 TaxID=1009370 RepID=F7NDM6_9FIRM|nr:long-chain-fatty-acid--CoA ligase [Acetonema longum]EGO65888.1 long-chain-fatty-acid-coa ligase [Acetonema longum DSM 6540]